MKLYHFRFSLILKKQQFIAKFAKLICEAFLFKNVSQSPCFLCCCHMCHRHPGTTEFSSTFLKKKQSTVVAFVVVEEEVEAVSLLPWLVVARVKKPAIERRKLSKRRAFQISAFLRPPTIFSAHFPLVKARKTDTWHGDMVTLTEPFPFSKMFTSSVAVLFKVICWTNPSLFRFASAAWEVTFWGRLS